MIQPRYKTYQQLKGKAKTFVDTYFTKENFPRLPADPHGYIYAINHNNTVRFRVSKKGFEYRGYKIHWDNVNESWRFYQRGAARQAINTMTPETDIDAILRNR